MYRDDFLDKKLHERRMQHALRHLKLVYNKTDFCSNDYLGIVRNNVLQQDAVLLQQLKTGSTGSRLLTGNYEMIEAVEEAIATFHETEAALIFNSGYDANLGLLSAIPQRGDTIIYDQLSHASIRDGIRLSFADSFSFLHNDLTSLEQKLRNAKGNIFVVTESVFSMDGDICPLQQMVSLCEKYHAHLIIDEAHATGVIGERGEGLVQQLQLREKIFCSVHTFGKALGCHGAVVAGSKRLKSYLVNFARSFVYSTALPEHSVAFIKASYTVFPNMVKERSQLTRLVKIFRESKVKYEKPVSATPIQAVLIPGNEAVQTAAAMLQQHGFDVRPILYPTVEKGKERLRIVLHAFNTEAELSGLLQLLQ